VLAVHDPQHHRRGAAARPIPGSAASACAPERGSQREKLVTGYLAAAAEA
jgi:hypothetical protein